MKKKQGVSLIVLVITILVILILASIIILNIRNTNPVGRANEAKTRADFKSLGEEFLITLSDLSISDSSFAKENININVGNTDKMRLYIPSITEEYASKLFIKKGNLLYLTESDPNYSNEEEIYARESGIKIAFGVIGDADGDGEITEDDCNLLQNIVGGEDEITSSRQRKACDVNGDNAITVVDVTELQNYINKKYENVTSNIGKIINAE